MNLSKQEESALLQVYDKYWYSYLNGDIPTLASLLAEEYTQIGSVESEAFDNKKDAVHFIETTIEQIAGKVDMRNRIKKIEPVDPFMLITEHCDLYVLTEGDWVFYARFRASSFLQKNEGHWKFIHQHSSMPDIRADEGENIATEKISRENIELRDAIKRRTVELEQKNQELAVEASLERVRTVAMGMRKPDDLPGICEVLFKELQSMGFTELRNAMINIHNDEKSTFINYDFSEEIGPSINHLNYKIHPVIEKQIKQIRSTHDAFSETVFSGQDLTDWKAFRKRIGEKDDPRIDNVSALNYYFYSIGTGAIGISTFGPITTEKLEQLKRFRNVFEFAYRRYMDVTQAETQAREAQIEASLERIRAASLAMRDSSALGGIIFQLYGELTKLDAKLDRCFIMIVNPENKGITWWMAGQEGLLADNGFFVQMNQHPSHLMYLDHCDKRKKKWTYLFGGKEKSDCDHFIFTQTELARLPESIKAFMSAAKQVHLSGSSDQFGSIVTGSFEPLPDEQQEIISRFTIAFNQAYIRFLDLQKAEAQARESQIQLALERVRARTMAMQKSEELKEVAKELRVQLAALGTDELETCAINLYEESDDYMEAWVAIRPPDSPKEIVEFHFNIPKKGIIIIEDMIQAYHSGVDEYLFELGGSKGAQWMNTMEANMPEMFAVAAASDSYKVTGEVEAWFTCDYFSGGALVMITMSPPQHESRVILKRFKQVFGLAYRRFADLKKAEAQTREALIEAALERVRSRSMSMQKSEDLKEVIKLVYQQLIHLKINLDHSGFVVDYTPGGDWHFWIADEQDIPSKITHPYFESVWANQFNKAKEKGADFFVTHLNFEEKNKFYNELLSYVPGLPVASKDFYLNAPGLAVSTVLFENVSLYIENFSGIPYTEEENNTLMRFGKVFQQTYTRFLDLQKAEAQARESQIELGLERVRARAMAMQDSGELSDLVATLLHELTKLDFSLTFCIINIYNEPDHSNVVWAANPLEGKAPESYYMKFEDYPFHHAMMREWKAGTPKFVYVMEGKEKEIYDDYLYTDTEFRRFPEEIQTANRALERYVASFVFSQFGGLQTVGDKPLSNESLDILYRFGKVFDQTYTRFLDLQKAEAQILESLKRASVDRVRAEIASMRTTTDLDRITPLIWKELTILGISFVRCGVFIMDEQEEHIHAFLSAPDGKAIAAIHLPYQSSPLADSLAFWREKKIYITHWNTDQYAEFADAFIGEADLEKRTQFLHSVPKEGIYLHLLPFLQGMLYVGNITKLEQSSLNLIQSVADAFSTAYARYEDFNKLEAAKQQVDKTLTDLKQAQSQLVQAEKMASLGELTAGIAHEIQNPLNFVNNFSEINTELSDEIVEAAKKGDLEEIIQLAADIKSNQDKISEHGKRADAIVKGMLQHSRSSSGVKEPTDINKLADEYFRLSYHGLRAKDKTFNAIMKTDFDDSIENINIIPQDIGRVLLNLYNNAFYAVNEKMKSAPHGYEPQVTLTTRLVPASDNSLIHQYTNSLIISVKDNGNGIPDSIKDKIFQPFFTTKPTGQGTGLGLSLSYDIVKAHGGELKVDTKEGEGTEFVIQLPVG